MQESCTEAHLGMKRLITFHCSFEKKNLSMFGNKCFKTNIWIRHCFAFSQILTLFKNWLQKKILPQFSLHFQVKLYSRDKESHVLPLCPPDFLNLPFGKITWQEAYESISKLCPLFLNLNLSSNHEILRVERQVGAFRKSLHWPQNVV